MESTQQQQTESLASQKNHIKHIYCQIHEEQPIEYSCKHDGEMLCKECLDNHQDHSDQVIQLDTEKLSEICNNIVNNFPQIRETIRENLDRLQNKDTYTTQDINAVMQVADFYQKINVQEVEEEQLKKDFKTSIKNFFPGYKPAQSFNPLAAVKKTDGKLDSVLITTAEQQQLIKQWIGYDCQLKLLFRGTKNGFKGQKFHFLCDNKGASLTVLKTPNGFIFGGYTAVQQHTTPTYMPTFEKDPTAFLFNLAPHKTKHEIMNNVDKAVSRSKVRICCFGRTEAHESEPSDLEVYEDCDKDQNNTANLGKCYALPENMTHGSTDAKKYLSGSSIFKVTECEVFQVKKI